MTIEAAGFKQIAVEDFRITEEPYYLPINDEVELFETAYERRIPVLLKGPTGAGKTRFVEYMSWRLHNQEARSHEDGVPLITVACHEDLTASDLVGRYLLEGEETRWIDGPHQPGRQGGRHLLPGRDRGGPQGHHRPDPPAD